MQYRHRFKQLGPQSVLFLKAVHGWYSGVKSGSVMHKQTSDNIKLQYSFSKLLNCCWVALADQSLMVGLLYLFCRIPSVNVMLHWTHLSNIPFRKVAFKFQQEFPQLNPRSKFSVSLLDFPVA